MCFPPSTPSRRLISPAVRGSRHIRDGWLSLLAIALMTGTKPVSLPLLLPWAILMLPQWPLFRRHWLPTLPVAALAGLISFLPIAVMNEIHSGDWLARTIEGMPKIPRWRTARWDRWRGPARNCAPRGGRARRRNRGSTAGCGDLSRIYCSGGEGRSAGVGPAGRARTSRPLGGAHRGGREQCLSGGHHRIHLLPWVPVFWFWIDGAPPLRPVAEPLGSQVSVAGEGIVVSELSPARWADDKVLRRIFEPFVSTDWAAIHVFRPSLTIRLKILQWRLPVARQLSYDHERSDFAVPGQHAEFTRSRVKAYQISVPGAFQGSLPQWPHHKGVRQPFVLVGSRGSELIPVPHEMPLKIVAMFKRHGAGYFTNCTSAGDGLRGGGSAGGTPGRFFAPAATVLVGLSGCMSAARANNLRKRI